MKRAFGVLLVAALVGAGGGAAVAVEEESDSVARPVLIADELWCQSLLPGKNLAAARKTCASRLGELSSKSIDASLGLEPSKGLFVIPEAFIEALVLNDIDTVGIDEGDPYVQWDGGEPQVASDAPAPAATPQAKKLPKPDWKATAKGWEWNYGPGKKKPFNPKTLKVWVNGERVVPRKVNGKAGTWQFRLQDEPEEGDIVQATYKRVKYVPPKPTYSDGVYKVGRGIKPGIYRTKGQTCYYARLRNLSGDLFAIIDNDIGSGNRVMRVYKSDKWVELKGGCTWR